MPLTRSQMLRLVQDGETTGLLPLDRSEIIADMGEGWTLRRMTHAGDFRREGELMANCCASYVPELVPNLADFTMADRPDLCDDQRRLELVSLRDKDNMPHATAWLLPGHHLYACWGRGERTELSPAKAKQLRDWCEQTGVEWGGTCDGWSCSFFTTMRGVCSVAVDEEQPLAPWHARGGNARQDMLDRLAAIGQLMAEYERLCEPALDHLADKARELARIIERNEATTHRLTIIELFERDARTMIEHVVTGKVVDDGSDTLDSKDGELTIRCNQPAMCKKPKTPGDVEILSEHQISSPAEGVEPLVQMIPYDGPPLPAEREQVFVGELCEAAA
jgi:hypothetical protein